VSSEEVHKAVGRRNISPHRMRRPTPVVLKVTAPACSELTRRMRGQRIGRGSVSHRRSIAPRLRPRNINNSEP
jgi:hypothetical protein